MPQLVQFPQQTTEQVIRLDDGTLVYDLLEGKSLEQLRNKYVGLDVVAFRIHGLVGDVIKATTVMAPMILSNPSRKYVILQSYSNVHAPNDTIVGQGIIKDVFSGLVSSGVVIGLYFNNYGVVGNMSYYQYEFLRNIGCVNIIDLYYLNSDAYKFLKRGVAYLGFPQPEINNNKVALFRFSGFHSHIPLRHIPEDEWLSIEEHLLKLDLGVCLYGYDDVLKTLVKPENDFRKKLSVLGTIKHASDAGLCISTTTYLPLFLHHFVPCLVFIDPVDTVPVNLFWRSNHNYIAINTQLGDHVQFVQDYISRWYLANQQVELSKFVKDSLVKKDSRQLEFTL